MYFCKCWPDDGLLRPKLVANNRIIIKINTQMCQKECIFNLKQDSVPDTCKTTDVKQRESHLQRSNTQTHEIM